MSDLVKQLKQLKSQKIAGAVSGSKKAEGRANLMEAIGHQEAQATEFSFAAYYRFNIRQIISTPMTVGAMVFVLAISGWITSVNAAQALPGDTLYSVKIAGERAQLRLAPVENKAVLHTEFAERRLEEAEALKDDPERQAYVQPTMEAFKAEVARAGDELRRLQESQADETSTVATRIDKKIDELSVALGGTETEASEEIEQAITVTREVSNSVVDVIVETHEATASTTSTRDVQSTFKKDLIDIEDLQALNLGRLSVIERALETDAIDAETAQQLEAAVLGASDQMAEARTLGAAGGYRAAFDILHEAEDALRDAQTQIVELEIAITTSSEPEDDGTEEDPSS